MAGESKNLSELQNQITEKRKNLIDAKNYNPETALKLTNEFKSGLISLGYGAEQAQDLSSRLYRSFLQNLKVPADQIEAKIKEFELVATKETIDNVFGGTKQTVAQAQEAQKAEEKQNLVDDISNAIDGFSLTEEQKKTLQSQATSAPLSTQYNPEAEDSSVILNEATTPVNQTATAFASAPYEPDAGYEVKRDSVTDRKVDKKDTSIHTSTSETDRTGIDVDYTSTTTDETLTTTTSSTTTTSTSTTTVVTPGTEEIVTETIKVPIDYTDTFFASRVGSTFDIKEAEGELAVSRGIALREGKLADGSEIKKGTSQTLTIQDLGKEGDSTNILKVTRSVTKEGKATQKTLVSFSMTSDKVYMHLTEDFVKEMRQKNPNFLKGVDISKPIEVSKLSLSQNKIETVDLKVGSEKVSLNISSFFINAKDSEGNSVQQISKAEDGTVVTNDFVISPVLYSSVMAKEEAKSPAVKVITIEREEPLHSANLVQYMTYMRHDPFFESEKDHIIPFESTYSVPVKNLTKAKGSSYLNLLNIDGKNYAYLQLKPEEKSRSKEVAQSYEIRDLVFEQPLNPAQRDGNTFSLTLDVGEKSAKYVSVPMTRSQALEFIAELCKEDCDFAKCLPEGASKDALIALSKRIATEGLDSPFVQAQFDRLANENNTRRKYNAYVASYDKVAKVTDKPKLNEEEKTVERIVKKDGSTVTTVDEVVTHDLVSEEELKRREEEEKLRIIGEREHTEETETETETHDHHEETHEETHEDETKKPPVPPDRVDPGPEKKTEKKPEIKGPMMRKYADDEFEKEHPSKPVVRDSLLILALLSLALSVFVPGMQFLAFGLAGAWGWNVVEGWNIGIRMRNGEKQRHNDYVDSIDPEKNAEKIKESTKMIDFYKSEIETIKADTSLTPKQQQKKIDAINKQIQTEEIKIAQAEARTEIGQNCSRYENYNPEINKTLDAAKALRNMYDKEYDQIVGLQHDYLSQCVESKILTQADAAEYASFTTKIRNGEISSEDVTAVEGIMDTPVEGKTPAEREANFDKLLEDTAKKTMGFDSLTPEEQAAKASELEATKARYKTVASAGRIQEKIVTNAADLLSNPRKMEDLVTELLGSDSDSPKLTPEQRNERAANMEKGLTSFLKDASTTAKAPKVDAEGKVVTEKVTTEEGEEERVVTESTGKNARLSALQAEAQDKREAYVEDRDANADSLQTLMRERAHLQALQRAINIGEQRGGKPTQARRIALAQKNASIIAGNVAETFSEEVAKADEKDSRITYATDAAAAAEKEGRHQMRLAKRAENTSEINRTAADGRALEDMTLEGSVDGAVRAAARSDLAPETSTEKKKKKPVEKTLGAA